MKIKHGIITDIGRISAQYSGTLTAALIGAGATIASGATQAAVGGRMNRRSVAWAREQNKLNQQFAREQNQWNLDLWNKANEYNSPLEQRKRLEEAGYNTALLDPSGNQSETPIASANLANQQAPQPNAAALGLMQMGYSNIANSALNYLNAKKTEAETEKLTKESTQVDEMTKQIQSQTKCNEEQARLIAINVDKANVEIQQTHEQILSLQLGRDKTRQDIAESITRIDLSKKDYDLRVNMTNAQIDKIFSDIGLNKKQIEKISEDIVAISVQCAKTGKEISILELDAEYKKIINKYAEESQINEIEGKKTEIYNSLAGSFQTNVAGVCRTISSSINKVATNLGLSKLGYKTEQRDYGDYQWNRINNRFGVINQQY